MKEEEYGGDDKYISRERVNTKESYEDESKCTKHLQWLKLAPVLWEGEGDPGPDMAMKGSADEGASPELCNCLLNMMH